MEYNYIYETPAVILTFVVKACFVTRFLNKNKPSRKVSLYYKIILY